MKRVRTILFLLLSLLLCLSACGKKGELNEGDCPGIVSFGNIPKEFSLLDENLQNEFEVVVWLKHLTSEKEYSIHLNKANGFRQEVSLHPGNYSVSAYSTMSNLVGLDVKLTEEIAVFDYGRDTLISILPKNPEEFAEHWMETHPQAEILSADKYSGLVQVNRKVMTIKEMISELGLSDMTETIESKEKSTLQDAERGITIVLQNQSSSPKPLSECEVLSLYVTKNTVVFPDGVTLGTAPEKVCHRQNGLYGEPTKFEGFYLFGWDLDNTSAVYQDPISGNRITIEISPDGAQIDSILYELKAFKD
ncbi:MAG: hypothetical protein J6Z22_09410 [Lachnospiraceae bacterium]|nr:hypothetical protein [Lachnospiraceae bacterium]MBP5732686.1 hypothetical protein [Lachnospiraceae bacterium]